MGPTSSLLSCVARAMTPASSGAASDVPDWASMVRSGTERIGLRVTAATPFWYAGRGNTEEYPAPSASVPPACQTGSGPSRIPVVGLRFGTLPPTAVIHPESSQAAVSGVGEVCWHCPLATARFCTTPQSPVATSTGTPAAAAVRSAAFCEVIWAGPAGQVVSPL